MNNKFRLLFLFVLYFQINGYSQALQNPINRTNNALTGITSDFGPRFLDVDGTRFHFGLDYGLAAQGPAYPVEAGIIGYLPNASAYLARVDVGNWRYMHCFFGTNQNGTWEIRNAPNGYPVLIFRNSANTPPIVVYAASDYPGSFYQENLTNYPISNFVTQDVVIFRARNNHLHLDRGNNIFVNPLEYLPRTDVASPNTTIRLKYNASNEAIEFPSNIIYGNIIVESDINYGTEYDLDDVTIEVERYNLTSGLFAWHYTGNNHMVLSNIGTGESNTPQYNIRQVGNIDNILTDVREGVFPRDGAGRDIFKFNFNSLIANSSVPSANVFYKDGQYTFRVTASDISGNNNPQELVRILDNFRPYVQKVEIKSDGIDVYKGEWEWNAAISGIKYIPNGNATSSNPNDGIIAMAARNKSITIKVTASESLTALNIVGISPTLPAQALAVTSYTGTSTDTEGKVWEFVISASAINVDGSNDGVHFIRFTGNDLACNPIENYSPAKTIYLNEEIPQRVNATTWNPLPSTNQGYDNLHCFKIGGASVGPDNIPVSINASSTQVQANENVTFTAVILDGDVNPDEYSYNWKFKSGTLLVKEINGTKTVTTSFSNPAIISVELTLSKNGVNAGYVLKSDFVNVGALLNASISVDKEYATIGEEIRVTASANGATGYYAYSWTFGNGCSPSYSTNKSETISYTQAGTKTLQLVVSSGTVTKTVYKTIVISENPPLTVDFSNGIFDNYLIELNESVWFISTVENASGWTEYFWDFGDDTPLWDINRRKPHPVHTFTEEGSYTVTLRVTDEISTRTISHTYHVSYLSSLGANFSYTISSTDPSKVSFTFTANESLAAILWYGDGSNSQTFEIGSLSSSTLEHSYAHSGEYEVTLRVWFNNTWTFVSNKQIVIDIPNNDPFVLINFYEFLMGEKKPYVQASVGSNFTPFSESQGVIGAGSPCFLNNPEPFFYRFQWQVSVIGTSNPQQPCTGFNYYPTPETSQISVDVTGANGIVHSAERTITIYPPLTVSNIKPIYNACQGSEVLVTPILTGGKPPYKFDWYKNNQYMGTATSMPVFVESNTVNCKVEIRDSRPNMYHIIEFKVQPSSIIVNAGNSINLCQLNDIDQFNASVSGGSGSYVYNWEPYNNLSSVTELNPMVGANNTGTTTYMLTATDEYGCSVSDQVSVSAYNAIEINMEPTYYVNGTEATTISPVILNGSGSFSYSWSNGETTKDILANQQTGLYLTLTVTDNVSGCVQSASCMVMSISSNFDITPNTIQRGKRSYDISIPVTSQPGNISYSAHSDSPWLTISSGANGYTGSEIICNISENNTSNTRIGKITLESPDALNSPFEVIIIQTNDAIRRVPQEYSTIQAAIDAALDGEYVEVDEGIYNENIVFSGTKKISVKSTGCPENTIISSASINKPVVKFTSNSSILQGFTIEGGINTAFANGNGGGILTSNSNAELYDLVIKNNSAFSGGGLYIAGEFPKIINVKILDNNAVMGGGATVSSGFSSSKNVLFQNCLIAGNEAYTSNPDPFGGDGSGGGLALHNNVILDNVTVTNNISIVQPDYYHGGILFNGECNLKLYRCIINEIITAHLNHGTSLYIAYSNINNTIKGSMSVTYYGENLQEDPMLDENFGLLPGSPCIDTGDDPRQPQSKFDKDGSICDMGFTGGKGVFDNTIYFDYKGAVYPFPPRFIEISKFHNLTYTSGENENFVATKQITIYNGFKASTGSLIKFKIQPNYNEPFLYDDNCFLTKDIPETKKDVTDVSIYNSLKFNLYPNPNEGLFILELVDSNSQINKVEVYSSIGILIDLRAAVNSSITELNISNEVDGIYFVRVYTNSGEVINAKVIKSTGGMW